MVADCCEDLRAALVEAQVGGVQRLGSIAVCDGIHMAARGMQSGGPVAVQHRLQALLVRQRQLQRCTVRLYRLGKLPLLEGRVAGLCGHKHSVSLGSVLCTPTKDWKVGFGFNNEMAPVSSLLPDGGALLHCFEPLLLHAVGASLRFPACVSHHSVPQATLISNGECTLHCQYIEGKALEMYLLQPFYLGFYVSDVASLRI